MTRYPGEARRVSATPVDSSHSLRRMLAGALVVLIPWMFGCARASQSEAIRNLKDATVPPSDTAPALDNPAPEGQSLRYSWQFDSRFDASTYLDWVTRGFTNQGFSVRRRDASSVELTRVDGGDAYRIRIEVGGATPTRVQVVVRASPD